MLMKNLEKTWILGRDSNYTFHIVSLNLWLNILPWDLIALCPALGLGVSEV